MTARAHSSDGPPSGEPTWHTIVVGQKPRTFSTQEFPSRATRKTRPDSNTLRVVAPGVPPYWVANLRQAIQVLHEAYRLKKAQPKRQSKRMRKVQPVDGPSTSVRTVSGGLPTLGQHHR